MSKFGFRQILPDLHLLVYSLLMGQAHRTTPVSETVLIEYAYPNEERVAYGLKAPSFLIVAAVCGEVGCGPSAALSWVGILGVAIWFFVGDCVDRVRRNMLSPIVGLYCFSSPSYCWHWRNLVVVDFGFLENGNIRDIFSLLIWPIGLAGIGWKRIKRSRAVAAKLKLCLRARTHPAYRRERRIEISNMFG
ncbi:MAG: hypothetical protein ACKV2U_21890 [Bryobacteraceae bacterium]